MVPCGRDQSHQFPARSRAPIVPVRPQRTATGPPKPVRWLLRIPLLRDLAPRLAAFGARPEHVRPAADLGNLRP